ncbi:HNH endonuclease [Microcystis phage MinS1]|nr:HNH endonuclease [Microcystis phage MinS1]
MADRTCSVSDCNGKFLARGWCAKHYARWKRTGDPLTPGYGQPIQPCSIAGCDRAGTGPRGLGWCQTHYRRYQRHGSPYVASRIVGNNVARFESYLALGATPIHAPELGACWLWTGASTKDGYGVMEVQDLPTASAHRWSYRHHVGPLLDGLELDHLCRIRNCVNPWHLDQVPHVINIERANTLRYA